MKKFLILMLAGLTSMALTAGCRVNASQSAETAIPAPAQQLAQQEPTQQQPAQQPSKQGYSGPVVETMNSGGYTYVQVDTGTQKIWAAAPQFQVAVGDEVVIPGGLAMQNYHSKTLNRDFDLVYFLSSIKKVGGEQSSTAAMQMPAGHPPLTEKGSAPEPTVDLSAISKAEGGQTVEEIFTGQADLSGKEVKVRGKVVKFSSQIMGKNWIHLQDGTGTEGTNDLTVTTAATPQVGDIVVVSGVLSTDKDFGYGYQYDVILENAEVTVE